MLKYVDCAEIWWNGFGWVSVGAREPTEVHTACNSDDHLQWGTLQARAPTPHGGESSKSNGS